VEAGAAGTNAASASDGSTENMQSYVIRKLTLSYRDHQIGKVPGP